MRTADQAQADELRKQAEGKRKFAEMIARRCPRKGDPDFDQDEFDTAKQDYAAAMKQAQDLDAQANQLDPPFGQ